VPTRRDRGRSRRRIDEPRGGDELERTLSRRSTTTRCRDEEVDGGEDEADPAAGPVASRSRGEDEDEDEDLLAPDDVEAIST
jgi:hypothetical protein